MPRVADLVYVAKFECVELVAIDARREVKEHQIAWITEKRRLPRRRLDVVTYARQRAVTL